MTRFAFKGFQRHDYACLAIPNGGVLGHDTGGGKTAALYVMALLKVGFDRDVEQVRRVGLQPLAACLIVAPGDLHAQIAADARNLLRIHTTTVIDSQAKFLELATVNPHTGRYELPPGFYITSFTQLASNGVAKFPARHETTPEFLNLSEAELPAFFAERGRHYQREYELLRATPALTARALETQWKLARREYDDAQVRSEADAAYETVRQFTSRDGTFDSLTAGQREFVSGEMFRIRYMECVQGIGTTHLYQGPDANPFKVKCVYSPALVDHCGETFAHVSVDEAVKMKGELTHVGVGVRQLNPRSRTVLTATPIKNRLPDIFRLAWWAAGGHTDATARWPYADEASAREEFADEFLITERNLTKEEASESNQRFVKRTPQVCNIHRLWKLLAPVVLRRRKKDFGEDIVKKFRHVVRVPLGRQQAEVYRYHLNAKYRDCNGRPAIGAKLQALRIATANPASELLVRPSGDRTAGLPRSPHTYVPKLASALQLVAQILARGEQVVIFSAFHDSLDALSARLNEAGVRHAVADGRMTQKKRGAVSAAFKLGPPKAHDRRPHEKPSPYPVLLAGVECMAEGHSFHRCNNVILLCYSWAFDKFEQAINRAHRLNSLWDVNVYPIICEGSIDRKLEALIQEKGDAAELVLDGTLQNEESAEVNLAELLQIAAKEFNGNIPTLDETELLRSWPPLRLQLGRAMQAWTPEPTLTAAQRTGLVTVLAEAIRPLDAALLDMADLPLFAMETEAEPETEADEALPLWRQRLRG